MDAKWSEIALPMPRDAPVTMRPGQGERVEGRWWSCPPLEKLVELELPWDELWGD